MKDKLLETLKSQKELLESKPKSQHTYYIESFQDELAEVLGIGECDCLPDELYLTLDSLEYYEFLIDDLMKLAEVE